MKIVSVFFILLSFFSFAYTSGQEEIDFRHKSLKKTLEKEGIYDWSVLEECILPDSILATYRIHGKYFLITDAAVQYKYIYVGRVSSCRAGGCSVNNAMLHDNNVEYFDYFILFDTIKTIRKVEVFNYQATHGQEITAKGWLRQFVGYNASEPLQVNKNIDAISGATISVSALTFDIKMKTDLLQKIML